MIITRSSWINCVLRDDETVYWISIGHYEAVAVGNRWYWVSRGHSCLYILHKVEIWTGVTDAWLTDRLTTLKDRATQLLKKYKSGALVTQLLVLKKKGTEQVFNFKSVFVFVFWMIQFWPRSRIGIGGAAAGAGDKSGDHPGFSYWVQHRYLQSLMPRPVLLYFFRFCRLYVTKGA